MLLGTDFVSKGAAPDKALPLICLAVVQTLLPGSDACHHDAGHVIQHALHSTSPCMVKSQQHFPVQGQVLCSALSLTLHTQNGWQILWAFQVRTSCGYFRCALLAHAQLEGYEEHDYHAPSPGCRPSPCARCGSPAGTPARGRGPPGPPSARGGPAAAARPPSCASAAHKLCIRRTACGHLRSCTGASRLHKERPDIRFNYMLKAWGQTQGLQVMLVRLLFSMCRDGCLPHTERLSAVHLACSSVTPAAGPGKTCLRYGRRIRVLFLFMVQY